MTSPSFYTSEHARVYITCGGPCIGMESSLNDLTEGKLYDVAW